MQISEVCETSEVCILFLGDEKQRDARDFGLRNTSNLGAWRGTLPSPSPFKGYSKNAQAKRDKFLHHCLFIQFFTNQQNAYQHICFMV